MLKVYVSAPVTLNHIKQVGFAGVNYVISSETGSVTISGVEAKELIRQLQFCIEQGKNLLAVESR